MSRRPCRTAESDVGSEVLGAYFGRPEGVHRPLKTLAGITLGIALGVVTFIALGNAFGVLISLTDSAAPAGVYRIVSGGLRRGDLVAVCLPIAVAHAGLARGYLRGGTCPGKAEPVRKVIGALPGDEVRADGRALSIKPETGHGLDLPRESVPTSGRDFGLVWSVGAGISGVYRTPQTQLTTSSNLVVFSAGSVLAEDSFSAPPFTAEGGTESGSDS